MNAPRTELSSSFYLGQGRDRLLRLSMKHDAVASGALGVLALAAAPLLDGLLGMPTALLQEVGLFLAAYAAALSVVASRPSVNRSAARAVVALNMFWAAASVVLVAGGWLPLTGLGTAFVLLQAGAVVLFAALQIIGLRCARPAAASPAAA